MAEESGDGHLQKALTTENNQDDLIIAQERQIEREIAETTPLISDRHEISSLQKEYADDDTVYLEKLKDLKNKYRSIRRTRGDGNCFFRAFAFAYLECLLDDKQEFNRFKELISNMKDDLVSLGFSQFTIEDFHDTFMEVVEKVGNQISVEDLLGVFNDQNLSDYLVVYMRLITSGQLQKNSSFFASFVEGERSMKEFCHQEVEPMYKESDHIHIIALTTSLNVGVRIQYMDRGEGGKVNAHDFPEPTAHPKVHLLYRPGHYDILYE
uniref:Ubiquitin thioesterase n=1 Tax=Scolopendra viridis TaxID=118503 RepID=A0A4D5R974_SCOVI